MDHEPNRGTAGRATMLSLLLAGFFGGGFLLFLILVTGGFFLYVVLAVVVMGMIGLLHYVVWGESLTQQVAAEREAAETREREEARQAANQHPYGIREL